MVDLDAAALQIGYLAIAGSAGILTLSALSMVFPKEVKSIALSSMFTAARGVAVIQKTYEDNLKPTVAKCSNVARRVFQTNYVAPQFQLFLQGSLVGEARTIEELHEMEIDSCDYDMILYRFLDAPNSPMLKFDYIDEVTDEFAFSDVSFINVTLTIDETEYTMNLAEPDNFFVVDNVIFDREFVDWWCVNRLGFSEPPETYKITVIDHNADVHHLAENDALRFVESGFDMLEKNSSEDGSSASWVNEEDGDSNDNKSDKESDEKNQTSSTNTQEQNGEDPITNSTSIPEGEKTNTKPGSKLKKSGWFGW